MKVTPPKGGYTWAQNVRMRGRVYPKELRGQIILSKWPIKRGKTYSEVQRAWVDFFGCLANLNKSPNPYMRRFWEPYQGKYRVYMRDVMFKAATGNFVGTVGEDPITTPTFSLYRNASDALTANVAKVVAPDGVAWDNNVFYDALSAPSRITFKSAGLYMIGARANFDNRATDGSRSILFRLNGVTEYGSVRGQDIANQDIILNTNQLNYFHQGDYIEVMCVSTVDTVVNNMQVWGVAITPEGILP